MFRLVIGRLPRAVATVICTLAGAAAAQDMPAMATSPPAVPAQSTTAQPATAPSAQPAAPAQSAAAQPAAIPSAQSAAPAQSAAAQPAPVPPAQPAANPLNKGQLEQLVAPIALYPDPLLSQVLMASTYPLEIVEADRWLRDPAHQALKGEALTAALKEANWEPSVKALVPFPKLLSLMAEKLQWTEQLGNAFLAQQTDVMNAVQALRHDAMAAGNLKASPKCHCVIQTSGEEISILPSDTSQVCVPVYNPRVVYGSWSEPEYPPYFFPIPADFVFEPGYPIGFWPLIYVADFGPLWGWWSLDWGGHDIIVDRGRLAAVDPRISFAGNTWVHDPAHRGGVGYSDRAVASRFNAARTAAVAAAGRGALSRAPAGGMSTAAGAGAARAGSAGISRFGGGATRASGRFGALAGHVGRAGGATGAAAAGGGRLGGHIGHANFSPRSGGASRVAGGRPHVGGGGAHFGGGHAVAHANFAPAHMGGGGQHFGGGGGGHGGGSGGHGGGGDGHGGHH